AGRQFDEVIADVQLDRAIGVGFAHGAFAQFAVRAAGADDAAVDAGVGQLVASVVGFDVAAHSDGQTRRRRETNEARGVARLNVGVLAAAVGRGLEVDPHHPAAAAPTRAAAGGG